MYVQKQNILFPTCFHFLKNFATRQTMQTAVQTTTENTLHSWTPRNNVGTFSKKSAEILSFRHFFHSLVPHKSQVSIRLLRIPELASILQIVPANCTGLVEMYLMTMGRSKLFLTVAAYNLQILRPFWKRLELLFSSSALIASSQI